MSLSRIAKMFGGVGQNLMQAQPRPEPEPEVQRSEDPPRPGADELYAAWWEHLGQTEPKDWDLEGFYSRARGGPVSDKPLVAVICPGYRELDSEARKGRESRNAIRKDLAAHGIASIVGTIEGDSLVCRMRQRACHLFLCSPATHMLFVDADIEARDPDCVRKMLATGHDIIAGACPFKDLTGRTVHNLYPEDEGKPVKLDEHGCVEVQDAGTGFLMIGRKALIQMQKAYPQRLHMSVSRSNDRGAPLWALFNTEVVDGIYQSEDYLFCHLWQALGGKVYVWPHARFRHWGTHGFEASFAEQYGLDEKFVVPSPNMGADR